MSCPVAPEMTLEEAEFLITTPLTPNSCDELVPLAIYYNGFALYDGTYSYGNIP